MAFNCNDYLVYFNLQEFPLTHAFCVLFLNTLLFFVIISFLHFVLKCHFSLRTSCFLNLHYFISS